MSSAALKIPKRISSGTIGSLVGSLGQRLRHLSLKVAYIGNEHRQHGLAARQWMPDPALRPEPRGSEATEHVSEPEFASSTHASRFDAFELDVLISKQFPDVLQGHMLRGLAP